MAALTRGSDKKGRPRSAVAETELDGAAGIPYYRLVYVGNPRFNGSLRSETIGKSHNADRLRLKYSRTGLNP